MYSGLSANVWSTAGAGVSCGEWGCAYEEGECSGNGLKMLHMKWQKQL